MRLSLHQLRVFHAVAQAKGITTAAKSLHMTQPAVSNIIKQLERYYGTDLIQVVSRKVCLTHAGEVLLNMAEQVQNLLSEGHSNIAALDGEMAGRLKVAAVSTAKYFMPRLLAAFKSQYSKVDIELTVCNRQQVLQRLHDNIDDFVIMSLPPNDHRYQVVPFYDDKLVVAAHPNHAMLQAKKVLQLSDLVNEMWLLREGGSGTRIIMEKLFAQSQIEPHIAMAVGDNESIKQLIIAGMGISILSLQSIELELANRLVATLPIRDFPHTHAWHQVSSMHKKPSHLVKAFNEFVASHANLAHYDNLSTQTSGRLI